MKNRILAIFMIFIFCALSFAACDGTYQGVGAADTVFLNAHIYTMDEDYPEATAVAIKDGKFSYVGEDEGVQDYIGDSTNVIDLERKIVLPGLMEGHMHFQNLGSSLVMLSVFWNPKDVILKKVKDAAREAEPGAWIQGRGWLNTMWEDTAFPTKEELDEVAPDNPVVLTRADGHMAWYNSKAFEVAGITKDTPNPQGGEYLKTEDGELLGCVTDTAMNPISQCIPAYTENELMAQMLLAQEHVLSYGITSEMDAGVDVNIINDYKELYKSGDLKIRSYPLLALSNGIDSLEADYVRENPPEGILFDGRMHMGGVKIITDGSLGARSAAMLEEYSDRKGYRGEYRYTDEQAYEIMKCAYDNGYQICAHSIGDGSAHQIINTLERLENENPKGDVRLRIEHFQIVAPEDIDRALNMGIIPSMQFCHATSDMLMAEDRVGHERMAGAYAWRTVLDKGSKIIAGTDAPVELVNPWHNIYAGVTRENRAGEPIGGWYPEQKVTREEAIKAYTVWCAYGQFDEKNMGSITVGKYGDLCVIDRDVFTCDEDEIKDIQALYTVIGGEVVYERDIDIPTVLWHGNPIEFPTSEPTEKNGKVMAPLDAIASTISAKVVMKKETATVSLNDRKVTVDIKVIADKEYVDVRNLFEGLGQKVVWNNLSKTMSTSTAR